jgi:hypothetical protein
MERAVRHSYARVRDDAERDDDERDDLAIAPGRIARTAQLVGSVSARPSGLVLRAADGNAIDEHAGAALAAATSASSGAPLPTALLRKFEQSLGADLSGVRVHVGAASQEAARAVGARAYALGQDIHFGAGYFDPSSPSGEHLLAHEVAHTVQQAGGVRAKLEVSSPGDACEVEADRAADAMVAGRSATLASGSGTMRVARDADKKAGDADDKLSPLRQRLLELMKEYNGAVVGDPIFENIIHEKTWNDIKRNEGVLETINSVKGAVGMKTEAVAKFTTCIQTQGVLMRQAFGELHLNVKKGELKGAEFSALSHREDDKMHVAKPGDSERPGQAYVIVLGARGDSVASKANNAKYAESQQADASKIKATRDKAAKDAEDAAKAAADALEAVKGHDHSAVDLAKAQQAYNRASNALANAKVLAANAAKALAGADAGVDLTHKQLDKAREDDLARRDLVRKKYGKKTYQFQHVCFLSGPIKKLDDGSGKEEWPVFGGGQKVARDGALKEGAAMSSAIYDPATNELSAADNRSGATWVQGWMNADDFEDK